MASAAASASWTYAQMAAALPKLPPSQSRLAAQAPKSTKAKAPRPPAAPAAPASTRSRKPVSAAATLPASPGHWHPLHQPTYSPAQLGFPLGSPAALLFSSKPSQPCWPRAAVNLLMEERLPREALVFIASINDNRTVLIMPPQGYTAGFYAPYHD